MQEAGRDWLGQSARGHPAVPRAGVRPARCKASSPATLPASGRFHSFHHTGSKAPDTALLCSVPSGADKTDAGDRDNRGNWPAGLHCRPNNPVYTLLLTRADRS
jgi:hypothetical protein